MEFDIFFSISQTEVAGYMPSERVMFENFFEQVALADELGFGTAWVAESHLSTEVQKTNPGAGSPHFARACGERVAPADGRGLGRAWVAESHLSTEVQKTNPGAVIPHFVGEIGLNTDILQLAHRVFARTRKIGIGSAIMN